MPSNFTAPTSNGERSVNAIKHVQPSTGTGQLPSRRDFQVCFYQKNKFKNIFLLERSLRQIPSVVFHSNWTTSWSQSVCYNLFLYPRRMLQWSRQFLRHWNSYLQFECEFGSREFGNWQNPIFIWQKQRTGYSLFMKKLTGTLASDFLYCLCWGQYPFGSNVWAASAGKRKCGQHIFQRCLGWSSLYQIVPGNSINGQIKYYGFQNLFYCTYRIFHFLICNYSLIFLKIANKMPCFSSYCVINHFFTKFNNFLKLMSDTSKVVAGQNCCYHWLCKSILHCLVTCPQIFILITSI